MIMKLRNKLSCIHPVILLVLIWMNGGCSVQTSALGSGEIAVKQLDDRLRVEIDGELFTEYVFCVKNRPILYPVIGPYGGKRDQLFYSAAGCKPH
jgi:hypothetical protein